MIKIEAIENSKKHWIANLKYIVHGMLELKNINPLWISHPCQFRGHWSAEEAHPPSGSDFNLRVIAFWSPLREVGFFIQSDKIAEQEQLTWDCQYNLVMLSNQNGPKLWVSVECWGNPFHLLVTSIEGKNEFGALQVMWTCLFSLGMLSFENREESLSLSKCAKSFLLHQLSIACQDIL